MKILELGLKEDELGGWFAWGITIFRQPALYLTLPGACRIVILLRGPQAPIEPRISPGSNWYWLEFRFRCYRFICLEIEIPVFYQRVSRETSELKRESARD